MDKSCLLDLLTVIPAYSDSCLFHFRLTVLRTPYSVLLVRTGCIHQHTLLASDYEAALRRSSDGTSQGIALAPSNFSPTKQSSATSPNR